jgi:hypothetical protein
MCESEAVESSTGLCRTEVVRGSVEMAWGGLRHHLPLHIPVLLLDLRQAKADVLVVLAEHVIRVLLLNDWYCQLHRYSGRLH